MSGRLSIRRRPAAGLWCALLLVVTGCAHTPRSGLSGSGSPETAQPTPTDSLRNDLMALAPTVRADEAQQVAAAALEGARDLAREYGAVWPPSFHNFLVNAGFKKRGLCFQWAEDLLARLKELPLTTLELRWGIARAGTLREHNCIIVTAIGQPLERGVVLDAWRRSGRLYWTRVAADKYPWEEGELTASP